jgi:hypothetical protein
MPEYVPPALKVIAQSNVSESFFSGSKGIVLISPASLEELAVTILDRYRVKYYIQMKDRWPNRL